MIRIITGNAVECQNKLEDLDVLEVVSVDTKFDRYSVQLMVIVVKLRR